ncbi:MAG: DNA mismatch repair protein MutS [Chthonomonadaceae bacterium]|nr:DNA mismatch repair protein MutS [Chthonomonadaceae bacterium]
MRGRTPMMQQYFQAKSSHEDALVAMRVGDFYEFYGDDAETAAKALEITLTGREDGSNGRIAMAGVPFHSIEKYLARLVAQGFKVALCDQLEDPKSAKGLVKRGVTRVLSAGTVLEDSMLEPGTNNFLAAVCVIDGVSGFALLEPSTGEFIVTEAQGDHAIDQLIQEISRLRPTELLVDPNAGALGQLAKDGLGITVTERVSKDVSKSARALIDHFQVQSLEGFGIEQKTGAVVAADMVLGYATSNGLHLTHISGIGYYSLDGHMKLDSATRRSLELTQSMGDGGKKNTLLTVLDLTMTSMGSRLIRRWIDQPLLDREVIQERHEAVERLVANALHRGDLRESLKRVSDIERLVSRCCAGLATPRDLVALKNSLMELSKLDSPLRKVALGRLYALREEIGDHQDLAIELKQALVDDPPVSARDGGVFRAGYDLELDKLRDLGRNGKSYIAKLESEERSRTGIDKLKVGFNSVFGYYLEVGKAHVQKVPDTYIRKQTTANAERYITAELKEHESAVLGAEDKATALEAGLFHNMRLKVAGQAKPLLDTARAIAEIDVLASLAEVAVNRRYCRPMIVDEDTIVLEDCRHPVVESSGSFVPNDLCLGENARVVVLTGPNMSGKSTYLRMVALVVLMAQIGSFVPARSCRLGICDRVFTRVGARDELARGQSTFMVEMVESANILNNATSQSLVVLDEVGRGTSTYDGLAIAWAMVEHLAKTGAKTLFATHYHQLNEISDHVQTVVNKRVAVEDVDGHIVWTHRIVEGGADKSYGIHVAKLAGVPAGVLSRASEVLRRLEDSEPTSTTVGPSMQTVQLTLFEAEDPPVIKELTKIDVSRLTPIEALLMLDDWKKRFVETGD